MLTLREPGWVAPRGAWRRGVTVAKQGPAFCVSCGVRSHPPHPLREFPVSGGSETQVSVGFSGARLKPAPGDRGRDSRPRLGIHCAARPATLAPSGPQPGRGRAGSRVLQASQASTGPCAGPANRARQTQGGACRWGALSGSCPGGGGCALREELGSLTCRSGALITGHVAGPTACSWALRAPTQTTLNAVIRVRSLAPRLTGEPLGTVRRKD